MRNGNKVKFIGLETRDGPQWWEGSGRRVVGVRAVIGI